MSRRRVCPGTLGVVPPIRQRKGTRKSRVRCDAWHAMPQGISTLRSLQAERLLEFDQCVTCVDGQTLQMWQALAIAGETKTEPTRTGEQRDEESDAVIEHPQRVHRLQSCARQVLLFQKQLIRSRERKRRWQRSPITSFPPFSSAGFAGCTACPGTA